MNEPAALSRSKLLDHVSSGKAPAPQPASLSRQRLLQRIDALPIRPAAREYYVRWAESWIKARGNLSADVTTAFFDALGRSALLQD